MEHDDDGPTIWGWLAPTLMLATILLAMAVTAVTAEERVLSEATVGQTGLLCNTQAEVNDFIARVEKGASSFEAIQAIEGCGFLQRPVLMKVIAIDEVKTQKFKYLIVRFEFLSTPSPPQYGIASRLSLGDDA